MRDWRLWRQGRPYSAKSSSRILPQQGIKMNDKKQEILSYSDIGVLVSDGTSPQTFPMHWHDSPEFILAKKDGCKFGISDQEYILNKNDILLIWPRELHWVIYTPEKATLILQCTPFLLDYNNEYRVYETQIQKYHYIRCDESSKFYRSLRDDLLKAKDIYIGAESFAETKLKILLLQLLLKIMQKAIEEESKGDSERLPAYIQDKIRSACAYICGRRRQRGAFGILFFKTFQADPGGILQRLSGRAKNPSGSEVARKSNSHYIRSRIWFRLSEHIEFQSSIPDKSWHNP